MSVYLYPRPHPKRRAGSKVARIETALLEEIDALRADSSTGKARTTGRFLFYRLESLGVVEKEKLGLDGRKQGRQPNQDVSDVLSELKWADVVGFEEIVDRKRNVSDYTGWRSVVEGAVAGTNTVRLDPWDGAAPLLIVESESLAGLIEDDAYQYRVPLIPLSGQGSDGILWDTVQLVRAGHDRALYVGDRDYCGDSIERSFRERIETLSEMQLDWRRVALTDEQVKEHGLPRIMKTDKRFKPPRPMPAVEAEALDQRIMLPLIREAVEALLPQPLAAIRAEEEHQRAPVLEALNGLR